MQYQSNVAIDVVGADDKIVATFEADELDTTNSDEYAVAKTSIGFTASNQNTVGVLPFSSVSMGPVFAFGVTFDVGDTKAMDLIVTQLDDNDSPVVVTTPYPGNGKFKVSGVRIASAQLVPHVALTGDQTIVAAVKFFAAGGQQ
jgi:hypothetical protein